MQLGTYEVIQDITVNEDTKEDEWNLELAIPADIVTHVFYGSGEPDSMPPICPNLPGYPDPGGVAGNDEQEK